MARILITDGEQRSALAAVRSLGRAGHQVYVGAFKAGSLAGASRFVTGTAVLPDPMRAAGEFVDRMIELIESWNIDLVLPVTEAALLALLPQRSRIRAALPFPSVDAFERLCDKSAVAAEAAKLGIGVPRTALLDAGENARALEGVELTFPVVVKPHRSIVGTNGTRAKSAVIQARDRASLMRTLAGLAHAAYPVLLQERISGPGVGIFVLLHNDDLVAAFAHRRIREQPPWGGVSVYRESIPLDQPLLDRSVELLRRFGLQGAAMVEYKVDARTNTPYIMEINGRFWGSLQLAIDAGVDFPKLLVDAALTGTTSQVTNYRAGVRSRWFWGDVDNLLLTLRGRADGASRLRACFNFLRAFGLQSKSEILQLTDPMPAVRETLDWFAALRPARSAR